MQFQRIRDLREDKDLKQKEIANIMNVGLSTYQRYERGEMPISLENTLLLAEFYNVSIDYIAGRTNDKRGLTRSDLAEDETALIKAFRSFSERQKGRIEQVIKEIEKEQEQECKRKEA